jgi:membrane associated rhomboid family serine protease
MQNFWKLLFALILAWIVWQVVKGLVLSVLHIAFTIAVIAFLVWIVSAIYKSMTREKLKY